MIALATMRTETGRGWELRHVDSLIALRDLEDETVDGVITDPPYSSGGQFRSDRMVATSEKYTRSNTARGDAWRDEDFAGDNRDQRGFLAWASLWLADCYRVTRSGGVICLFSDWRQLPTMSDALQAGGWVWRGIVPWDKIHARPQMGRFSAQAEYALWGSKGRLDDKAREAAGIGCIPGLVSCRAVMGEERVHQTQKPEPVMMHLCQAVLPGGLILDPFVGFASTAVAAVRTGRRFLGFEISERHFVQATERLRAEDEGSSYGDRLAGQMGLFGK